jgi:hypothetical protein
MAKVDRPTFARVKYLVITELTIANNCNPVFPGVCFEASDVML